MDFLHIILGRMNECIISGRLSGQIAAQRCCLEIKAFKKNYTKSVEMFLEELIVRRELADNFCYYNPHYDRIEGKMSYF